MKTQILLLILCVSFVHGVSNHNSAFSSVGTETRMGKTISELQATKLGKMFFEFAEVTMKATGAVDSLLEGIRAFGRQIEERLDDENEVFDALAAEHNSKGLQLQSLINQAELDINRERKKLSQELIPRSEELDEILLNLKDKKENNKKQVSTAHAVRDSQHEAFVDETNNLTEAIRGIDESLELIDEMEHDGSVKASFLEITSEQQHKITKVLKQVKQNTEKFGRTYASFIQALEQLTESSNINFKDRQVFKEMKDLLNSLRANFQETLQVAYSSEDQQIANYNKQLKQLSDEEDVFDQAYAEAYAEREDKGTRITDVNTYIGTRESDLHAYQDRLKLENNSFASNQKIHDDLVLAINEELSTLEKVVNTIQSPPFQDFLAGKMAN